MALEIGHHRRHKFFDFVLVAGLVVALGFVAYLTVNLVAFTRKVAEQAEEIAALKNDLSFDSKRRKQIVVMSGIIRAANPRVAQETAYRYAQLNQIMSEKFPNVDPLLLLAIQHHESLWNAEIESPVGALGLMQIMPSSGRIIAKALNREDFEIDDLKNPTVNVEFGTWYLSMVMNTYQARGLKARSDDLIGVVLAEYNGGPSQAALFLQKRPLYKETDAYIKEVIALYKQYRKTYENYTL